MTTTDTEVMNHFPTAAALICAVHDRDADTTHAMLDVLDLADLRSIVVLLADMVPTDKRPSQLLDRVARNGAGIPVRREDWCETELRDAHAAYARRDRGGWAVIGEREYQRRAGEKRRERNRVNREALALRSAS